MLGRAPAFFGDGKGAGFLSDIDRVRDNFEITLEPESKESNYILKLVPDKKKSRYLIHLSGDSPEHLPGGSGDYLQPV